MEQEFFFLRVPEMAASRVDSRFPGNILRSGSIFESSGFELEFCSGVGEVSLIQRSLGSRYLMCKASRLTRYI